MIKSNHCKKLNLAIVGLGLIGGSIAKRLKNRRLFSKIIGIDKISKTLRKAKRQGAIDDASLSINSVSKADVVIIATPIEIALKLIPSIARILKPGTLLMDTCGLKSDLADVFYKSGIDTSFISLHPLTGKETSGIDSADENLFENKPFLIIPISVKNKTDISVAQKIVSSLNAKQIILNSYKDHDIAMSTMIHLPHILAYSLAMLLDNFDYNLQRKYPKYVINSMTGRSFHDMTRVVKSDPALVTEFLTRNKNNILKHSAKLKSNLNSLLNNLKNTKLLKKQLTVSRRQRLELDKF